MSSSRELRALFLSYFQEKGHAVVPSGSLIPGNDPTLLFTNAGMVPFKDVFLGMEARPYTRATSVQRCIRAGGKHNDLENVGYTARHHTFFEMLGNFSFGDYFKQDAIVFAWEFITQVLNISVEKLWVTVYQDDDEAAAIWLNHIGIPQDRLVRLGEQSNFWSMGDTGPCGPCTEIFYDHGDLIQGGPPGSPGEDGDRYIEIWNIVFMQYNRTADGQRHPLPKPSVDTGMGLERLSAVMQGVHHNYDTDLFLPIIRCAQTLCSAELIAERARFNILADHIRSSAFLIAEGIYPSNEGRGYVLRRIIRRAIRHGYQLGMPQPFFYQLVQPLVEIMGDAYPLLIAAQEKMTTTLKKEEEIFMQTLAQGLKLLEKELATLPNKHIPGEMLFKLYDTYGFPLDLTADYAREQGYTIDEQGFFANMAVQKNRSKQASAFTQDYFSQGRIAELLKDVHTEFVGYEQETCEARVLAVLQEEGDASCVVVLDRTPFYSEAGGQVGDQGEIVAGEVVFAVQDTQRNQVPLHIGVFASGCLRAGDAVVARVNHERRRAIRAHHSATHLLHFALRQVLGERVEQKGSLVSAERLRLDISYDAPISKVQLWQVEQLVNAYVCDNAAAITELMSQEAARAKGAMALFGEKYGETVRVLQLGDSVELCGGTHVSRTGDIGLFKITSESAIAAGIRRVEAVTGAAALQYMQDLSLQHQRQEAALQEKLQAQEKQLQKLSQALAVAKNQALLSQAKTIHGMQVLVETLHNSDPKMLRSQAEDLKNRLAPAVIVLATLHEDKVSWVVSVSAALTPKIHAGQLISVMTLHMGGKGGGKPESAQGGGGDPAKLTQALASVWAALA